MVYALTIDTLERRVQSDQLTAALIVANGGQAEAPTMAEVQRDFDAWLVSDFEPAEPDIKTEWRQVMGVA